MEREPGGRERGPGPGGHAEGEAARTEAGEPLGRPRQARRRGFSWRTPVAALLIVAGCVPAPVSVLAVWTARSNRVPRLAVFAVAGALLTVLGFGIGGGAWRPCRMGRPGQRPALEQADLQPYTPFGALLAGTGVRVDEIQVTHGHAGSLEAEDIQHAGIPFMVNALARRQMRKLPLGQRRDPR